MPVVPGGAVVDLCGGTGAWSQPYREAGYEVVVVDPGSDCPGAIKKDVRLVARSELPAKIRGVLAAPPCDAFSAAGAYGWARKMLSGEMESRLTIVRACLQLIDEVKPTWWALENPPGRLPFFIGPPAYRFQPWWFGDPWTKLTYLWGEFQEPNLGPLVEPLGGLVSLVRSAKERARTPPGFARAFFRVNG